jgi:hypothetical protein
MGGGARFHADKARRQRLEELQHLAALKLLPNDDLLGRVDSVNLEHVLGDIQTDGGNLHVNRSLMCFDRNDHPTAARCWERAPSTTSGTGSRTAANIIHVRSPCALRPFDGFVIGEQIERHVLSDGNQRSRQKTGTLRIDTYPPVLASQNWS